ncbi:MAG TPA: M28 family peptidase [Pseudoneobacillus sp.]|nr:M28 family peptidase [Pseudoneobacillus sp.]
MFRRISFYGGFILGLMLLIGVVYSFTHNDHSSDSINASKEMNTDYTNQNTNNQSNADSSSKTSTDVNVDPIIKTMINLHKEINADSMIKNVTYLAEQPRGAGTDGEKRAVDYIESQFKSLGYETVIQEFKVEDFKENRRVVLINNKPIEGEIRAFFGKNISGKVSAELVNAGKATSGEVGEDVKGKIALIESGNIPYYMKIENLLDKGAIGAIMYYESSASGFNPLVKDENNIPAVAITREQGLKLVEQLTKGPVKATVDVDVEEVDNTSYNVIATKKPDKIHDTGQIVTVGAHHDSVPTGSGANDDASGVAAVLELARIISKKPIDTEVRFITFGAEERGLIGSSHYVYNLSTEEKEKMIAHFQMDMVGAAAAGGQNPGGGLIMFTKDGRKNLVTDLGAAASKNVFTEAIPFGKLGRSDHEPFHNMGIPAALFIHAPLEPDYHQPTDTLDKISKEKLQQVAEIVGSAVYTIASPDTPPIEKAVEVPVSIEYQYEDRGL